MIRWSIRKILLYSRDSRMREVELHPDEVNIISGRSSTGKSAIVELIDYSMGSHKCFLPEILRNKCSWVGLLWQRGDVQFLACRQVPTLEQDSTGACYFHPGPRVAVPASANAIVSNANRQTLVDKVDEIFGIGKVSIRESLGKSGQPSSVSIRYAMPFTLVDDTVIINKKTVIRGQDDEHRQGIIDTLPYFLGVVDERFVHNEALLRTLKRKLERLRRENKKFQDADRGVLDDALALLREAASLGMIRFPETFASDDEIVLLLTKIAEWTGEGGTDSFDDHLTPLYEKERTLSRRSAELRASAAAIKRHMAIADEYAVGAAITEHRLGVIEVFRREDTVDSCPVCDQPIGEVSQSVGQVRKALARIRGELDRVHVGRPKLDAALQETQAAIEQTSLELETIRRQIRALVEESDRFQERLRLDQRRLYVAGGAKWFLKGVGEWRNENRLKEIQRIEMEIEDITEGAGVNTIHDRLHAVRVALANCAGSILKDLPFEKGYLGYPVDLNFSDLTLGVLKDGRRVLMRTISGDMNILSLHISLFLALHRHFYQISGKVPGVILFDQISRPFFPEHMEMSDDDMKRLTQYFDVLFNEIARGESLQIIVLEHAFLKDKRFHSATRARWRGEEDGLVPNDWPSLSG